MIAHINAFAAQLPPVTKEEMEARGGYKPEEVRNLRKARHPSDKRGKPLPYYICGYIEALANLFTAAFLFRRLS